MRWHRLIVLLGVLGVLVGVRLAMGAPFLNSAETICDGSDPSVLLCDDFDDGTWGTQNCNWYLNPTYADPANDNWCMWIYYTGQADTPPGGRGFNPPLVPGYTACSGAGVAGTNCAATSAQRQGTSGMSGEHNLPTAPTHIFVRLYIQHQNNYVPGHEKMLSLKRTGGQIIFGTFNFFGSNRYCAIPYFNPDNTTNGSWICPNQGNEIRFQNGHWYYTEIEVQLNTPGQANGAYRLWMNDCGTNGLNCTGTPTLRAQRTGLLIRQAGDNQAFGPVWIENWSNPSSQGETRYDQLVVRTQFIGFVGSTSGGPPPPPTDTLAPAPPTSLAITGTNLSWNAPTTNSNGTPLTDLANYRVYWGNTSRGGVTSPLGAHGYASNATIAGSIRQLALNVLDGTWYASVVAIDTSGNLSNFSNEITWTKSTTVDTLAPAPPIMNTVSGTSITWFAPTTNADGSPLTDLVAFRVYWGPISRGSVTSPTGPHSYGSFSPNISAAAYTLPLGTGIWYTSVVAIDSAGNLSNFSGERTINVGGTPPPPTGDIPSPPTNVSASDNTVSWTQATTRANGSALTNFKENRIYWGETSRGSVVSPNDPNNPYTNFAPTPINTITLTLTEGSWYTSVVTVDTDGVASDFSTERLIVVPALAEAGVPPPRTCVLMEIATALGNPVEGRIIPCPFTPLAAALPPRPCLLLRVGVGTQTGVTGNVISCPP